MGAGLFALGPTENGMPEIDASLMPKPLMGTDEVSIDDKGRVVFTKKKRDRLGDTFVMTLSDVGCIWVFPEYSWNSLLREISRADTANQGRQQYTRLILGSAEDELKFDAQRRVVIPHKLREKAGLCDGCTALLVGCGDRVEIWNKDQYEVFQKAPDDYNAERHDAVTRAYRQMTEKG